MHIPPHRLLPQDMVEVFDRGPPDEPHLVPVKAVMHASDAKHAMSTDPGRWALDPVEPEPELKADLKSTSELKAEGENFDD